MEQRARIEALQTRVDNLGHLVASGWQRLAELGDVLKSIETAERERARASAHPQPCVFPRACAICSKLEDLADGK